MNGQSFYMTYKMTNWFLAARHLALAVFGMVALTKPPTMKGCIYLFTAFWILLIHCNLFDAMTSQWVAPSRDSRAWAMLGCQQMDFPNMVFLIINGFALHQTWNVAYPAGEELVLNKPNHKNPTLSKVSGWIAIVGSLFFALQMWIMPGEISPDIKSFYERPYRRWYGYRFNILTNPPGGYSSKNFTY